MILRPAPLPPRARVLGGVALVAWAFAVLLLTGDVSAGRSFFGSGSFCASMSAALLWVLADAPLRYQVSGAELHVITRFRRVVVPFRSAARVEGIGRDRFAINGGFGWYGWFKLGDSVARAWVTDPAFAVRVETGGRPVLVSPAEPDRLIGAGSGV